MIVYWNDLSKDSRYKRWSTGLEGLSQPLYPGQLPQIRKNLINVVFAMRLDKKDNHAILSENIASFISRGVGIRFGLVPLLHHGEDKSADRVGT